MADNTLTGQSFLMKDVLEKLGVSQRRLAKLLDAPQVWVSKMYNLKHAPSWATAIRIARALNVSVGVFVDNDPARIAFFMRKGDGTDPTPLPPNKGGRPRKRSRATV